MMVPASLCLSSSLADGALNARVTAQGLPASWWLDASAVVTDTLSGSLLDRTFARGGGGRATAPGTSVVGDQLLVALMLAYERSQGSRSLYQPFIASLPTPTCGWSLDPAATQAALPTGMPDEAAAALVVAMSDAKREYQQAIATLSRVLDAANLGEEDVSWGVQHVLSRGLSQPRARVALIPAIDCLNHSSDSCPPATVRGQMTCYFNFDRRCALLGVDAGDELFLHYAARSEQEDSPLKFFLRFAFVPQECLEGSMQRPDMAAFQQSAQHNFKRVL